MEALYQVCSWGPDGENDVVYLVQASCMADAARLVDADLSSSYVRSHCSGIANAIIELGQSAAKTHGAQVVSGPFFALSGAHGGFRCWSRDAREDDWHEWSN
jgi:hypothetical protein